MTGQTDRQKKILEINEANTHIIRRLSQNAGIEVDPTGGRLEFLIDYMTRIGLFTTDQREMLDLEWVEHLNNKLVKAEAEVIARLKAQAEEERSSRAAAKLGVRPATEGIIVPGHHGRKNGTGRRGRG